MYRWIHKLSAEDELSDQAMTELESIVNGSDENAVWIIPEIIREIL